MMNRIITGIMASTLLVTSTLVLAEDHRERRHWGDHEIHRFGEHDMEIWRGGHWHHGPHGGQLGWWWIAAGMWYFYPAPIYPYPDPYTPPVTVINQPPASVSAQPAPQSWYYCDSAKGYYPYVPACAEAWRIVPAQPPMPAPQ